MKKAFAAVAFLALSTVGCAATEAYAFKVEGKTFSQDAVFEELAATADLQGQQMPGTIEGSVPDSYNSSAAAGVITQIIYMDVLVPEAAENMGIEVDDAALDRLESALPQDQKALLAGVSSDFRERLLRRLAYQNAVTEVLVAKNVDEDELRAAYEANKASFALVCTSLIVTEDLPTAQAAEARLRAGDDFATVFAQVVTDPELQARKGKLDCLPLAQYDQLEPGLADQLRGLAPGNITPAKAASFGAFILRVDGFETPRFEEVRSQLLSSQGVDTQQLFGDFLLQLGADAAVDVNPRFGTWTVSAEGAIVEPPEAPAETGEEGPEDAEQEELPGGLVPGGGEVPAPPSGP